MWVPPETIPPETKDPVIYHHPIRKSVGCFAAVRLHDGLLVVCREMGPFNGSRSSSFFRHFSKQAPLTGAAS